MKTLNNTELKGANAFKNGKKLSKNPYKKPSFEDEVLMEGLTSDYDYWKNGFNTAKSEAAQTTH